MQVLLFDNDHGRHERIMLAFLKAGHQISATSSLTVAEKTLRGSNIDMLIVAEEPGERDPHKAALMAEYQNPLLSMIFLSDRSATELDSILEPVPTAHCVFGPDAPPETIVALAQAAIQATQENLTASYLPPPQRAALSRNPEHAASKVGHAA